MGVFNKSEAGTEEEIPSALGFFCALSSIRYT
jgi:hypothetical protein